MLLTEIDSMLVLRTWHSRSRHEGRTANGLTVGIVWRGEWNMVDNYGPVIAMPAHMTSGSGSIGCLDHEWIDGPTEFSAQCRRCGVYAGLSSCKVCRAPIKVGAPSQRHKSSGWKHAACQPKTAKNLAATSESERTSKRHHGRVIRGTKSL